MDEIIRKFIGKRFSSVDLDAYNDVLWFVFEGKQLEIWDSGQSCCEERYLHTDDDLGFFTDCILLDISEEPLVVNPHTEYDDVTEMKFLNINTSKGGFQVVAYNIHDGSYGGFDLRARVQNR